MSAGFATIKNSRCMVTGSSGLVGARLVEMLFERGAAHVTCFDVRPPSAAFEERVRASISLGAKAHQSSSPPTVSYITGDLTNPDSVTAACANSISIVYHIAALVGPFFPKPLYFKVNVEGTANVIAGCHAHGVERLVMSSSPSTRFTGGDIKGLSEDELPIPATFLETYAETKAAAERLVTEACGKNGLLTISVAPHQVYGPHDELFVPALMNSCGNGSLRVFGNGENLCSFCYVDNYAHGLMCGADALYEGSPALGKFYVVTDSEPQKFWHVINRMGLELGFADLFQKIKLPVPFLMVIGYICEFVGWVIGKKLKLNVFNVKMLTIHRHFNINNARRDLKYKPLLEFDEGWKKTTQWYKDNWLEGWKSERSGGKKKAA
jgi:nucleoside-diphosphate-sugar epimerase